MGMRTILWDQDSFDWQIGPGVPSSTVDGRFQQWITSRKGNTDNENGHITLQHEVNENTVGVAMKWLPDVIKNFNVMPIHQCLDDTSPYWEESFVYPKRDGTVPPSTKNTSMSTSPASGSENKDNTNMQQSSSSSLHATVLPSMIAAVMLLFVTFF
jgi:hypothetical protein